MKNKISALMDGELDSTDVADTITQVKKTEELRNEWSTYHLIGDALRHPAMSTLDIAPGVRKKLAIEPTVLTPEFPKEKKGKAFAFAVAASMVTAVAAVTWMGGQTMDQPLDRVTDTAALQTAVKTESAEPAVITVPVLAQKEEFITDKAVHQTAAQADSDVILIPAPIQLNPAPIQLNDYMFAHEEFSPRTAIHGVSPYMRTVADPYK
jgi:sigma-E factor negative regulatory protein RseA